MNRNRHGKEGPGRRHLHDRLFGKGGGHQQDEHRPQAEQRTGGHHGQAPAGIRRRGGNGEELAHDRGNEDTERNRGEDISRDFKRIDGGKIGLDET